MLTSPPRYERPASLGEAAALLAQGGLRMLAGGTDVYAARVGQAPPAAVLDLSAVPGLRGITQQDGGWWFGATTTWADALRAPLPPQFNALKQAAREVGGVQVQNMGTLGGNLCNASPAADGTPVWLALDAQVELHSQRGTRRLSVAQFVTGPRHVALARDELLSGIWVPQGSPCARSHFSKLGARRYLVISIAMVAVAVDVDGDGRIAAIGVAVGACSAVAQRLVELEGRLLGRPVSALAQVDVEARDVCRLTPLDDVRASAAYRQDAVRTLVRRSLAELVELVELAA